MKVIEQDWARRDLIKRYVEYDARKKGRREPVDMDRWDWNDPDVLDLKLCEAGFKYGVISGFKLWDFVQLSKDDLLRCAIFGGIREFKGLPQALSKLAGCQEFKDWRPDRNTEWFDRLEAGEAFPREWALILRPAKRSERPAEWYIEDGTGRAICFLRTLLRCADDTQSAFAYLGKVADADSNFMRKHFGELLQTNEAGSG